MINAGISNKILRILILIRSANLLQIIYLGVSSLLLMALEVKSF